MSQHASNSVQSHTDAVASESTAPANTGGPAAQTLCAVILAGRLRQAPLQEALNLHLLCLPVGRAGTLLETWIEALTSIPNLQRTRVVVNTAADASSVRGVMPREIRGAGQRSSNAVEVMAEPRSWRGAAGIVRDVTEDQENESIVLVCEGTRLPPRSLTPLLEAITHVDPKTGTSPAGVVGVVGEDRPAGVYAFRRKALRLAPRVGYFDMKEQFLPLLARSEQRVVIARLEGDTAHLRDLKTYLAAAQGSLAAGEGGDVEASGSGSSSNLTSPMRVSSRASVSGSAVLDGFCIIEPGAVVEDGAVVHDSIVLWGATIGGGSIVSRSVIGPLASVEPRERVVRQVVSRK